MNPIFEVATKISLPLALAGFFATVVFLIYGQILSKRPSSSRTHRTHALIINRLFTLAMVATVLGFLGYAIDQFRLFSHPSAPAESPRPAPVVPVSDKSVGAVTSAPTPVDLSRKTAGEVFAKIQEVPRFDQERFFGENFKDKRIPAQGWKGAVEGEVVRDDDGTCHFRFVELDTDAKVLVTSCKKACELREHDKVTVQGALAAYEADLLTLRCLKVKIAKR